MRACIFRCLTLPLSALFQIRKNRVGVFIIYWYTTFQITLRLLVDFLCSSSLLLSYVLW